MSKITEEQKRQAIDQHKALHRLASTLQLIAVSYIDVISNNDELDGLVTVGGPRNLGLLRDMIQWMGEDDSMAEEDRWIFDVVNGGDAVWETLPEIHRPSNRPANN